MQVRKADQDTGQNKAFTCHPNQHPAAELPAVMLKVMPGGKTDDRERRQQKK